MTNNKTALVMLPGLDGTGLIFEPLLESLPQTIDPVVVRYPTDKTMSFQEHVDFARQQLPSDVPFVLLAESFSGPIGLQILTNPPKNLTGVIFVATFDRYQRPFLLDVGINLPQRLLLTLFTTTLLGRFFYLGAASKQATRIFGKALASVNLEVLSNRLQIIAKLPPSEPAFEGPCLYLQASHDKLVPERAAAQLQRLLPQLQVRQLAGPHIILLAHPEAGAKEISDFVSSLVE